MAEEDVAAREEVAAQKKELPPLWKVQSLVRDVTTRMHRAKSPTRHRFKQWVAGQRLLRKKTLTLTTEQFEVEKEHIKEMVLNGMVALYHPDGTRITSFADGRLVYRHPDGKVEVKEQEGEPEAKKTQEDLPKVVQEVPAHSGPPPVEDEAAWTQDDLKDLPNVGAGRERKLHESGIVSYADVAAQDVASLASLLNIPEEMAEEIRAAAERKAR